MWDTFQIVLCRSATAETEELLQPLGDAATCGDGSNFLFMSYIVTSQNLEKLVQILSPYSRNKFFKKTPNCDNECYFKQYMILFVGAALPRRTLHQCRASPPHAGADGR